MKKILPFVIVILAVGCGFAVLGYRLGASQNRASSHTLQFGNIVATYDALQKLQDGDVATAVKRLEAHCFSVAGAFLQADDHPSSAVHDSIFEGLIDYRRTYRTNHADWWESEIRFAESLQESYPSAATTKE